MSRRPVFICGNGRLRRVLCYGGTLDGRVVVVGTPPPPSVAVAVPAPVGFAGAIEDPTEPVHMHRNEDHYDLEHLVDHTGIPTLAYRLRRMVRSR